MLIRIGITPFLACAHIPLQRAVNTGWLSMKDIQVDLCCGDFAAIPDQLLDRSYVVANTQRCVERKNESNLQSLTLIANTVALTSNVHVC
jgi:hypothetical protein